MVKNSRCEVRLTNSLTGRFSHIDAMRAFAVVLVVIAHAGLGHIVPGGSGVTLFFTISGFIITHLVLKEEVRTSGFDLRRFYLRRFFKLAPPFFVIVMLPTAIYAMWFPVRWTDFMAQLFFVFNWISMSGEQQILPGSGVVWSLAIEEQFYIGFALLWVWLVRSPRRLGFLASVATLVVISSLLIRVYIVETNFSHERIYFGTDTRIDGIAMGVLFAAVYFRLEHSERRASRMRRFFGSDLTALLALGCYVLSLIIRDEYFRETLRYSLQALSAALLILYGLIQRDSGLRKGLQRIVEIRAVQVTGLASYSIYLVHLPLNVLTSDLVEDWPKALAVAFFAVSGVAVGVLIWRLIELPMERYKKRLENAYIVTQGDRVETPTHCLRG